MTTYMSRGQSSRGCTETETVNRTSAPVAPVQDSFFRDGDNAVREATEWMRNHVREWRAFQHLVLDMHEDHPDTPITRDTVYTLALQRGMTVTSVEWMVKRDHNLWAALVRYLIKYNPTLAGSIRIRHSVIDDPYPTPDNLPPLTTNLVVNRGQWQMHRRYGDN